MGRIFTVQDLQSYLRDLHPVQEPSVDQIIIGDPEMQIKQVGFCWQPYFSTLKEAYAQGVNVMVVHEPTFYTHVDLAQGPKDYRYARPDGSPGAGQRKVEAMIKEKADWITAHEMAIIRCHDVLDILEAPAGIPFAFGGLLGFVPEDIIKTVPYYVVYRLPQAPAAEVARQLARRMAAAGQPGVAFYGDTTRPVSSVAVGTGCYSNPLAMMDLEADMYISLDDVVRTWIQTSFATDSGMPLLVINHGTSEESGVKQLCALVAGQTGLPCRHFPQGCSYTWITQKD